VRIGIHANPSKPKALDLAARAEELLRGRAEVILSAETHTALGRGAAASGALEGFDVDVLIALGGDGTFLYTLHRVNVPLLPIHAGTMGFLAEIDGDNLTAFDGAIERLLKGHYYLEERMKIATQVEGKNLPDATNEVVLHTSQVAKMRHFEIRVDRQAVGRLRADGMIIATPTGSTSYALSALGPIIEPTVEGIVITALAPFLATQRAVLVEPSHTIGIRLLTAGKEGVVVIDGHTEMRLPAETEMVCYRSPRRASFVRFGSRYFPRLKGTGILPWLENETTVHKDDDADLSSQS
jgi:NAD+ kinase